MASMRTLFTRVLRALAPRRTGAASVVAADTETVELSPLGIRGLNVTYDPRPDGRADAGEIVWTWVPFAERDGRGKDRPVLIIARQSAERVYAVKLTSRSRDGEREYVSIGSGPWDPQNRPSWVDLDQLYSVHVRGLRREGSALSPAAFGRVADALRERYGWRRA
ncbi:type II toxin-antitoxin system PemK/MazF family toxin [Microbacterium sp. 18062]|uniref:type II toxin-antitoxin system PemK/MazF family toxin n=1 Tax=Microbacterium sp. 18062 TaxID=2681410 RepID=UPI001358B220|nr:type II toxin-antitoxin system PemK/MazF family toxin [Microbacterium sp. 18062]